MPITASHQSTPYSSLFSDSDLAALHTRRRGISPGRPPPTSSSAHAGLDGGVSNPNRPYHALPNAALSISSAPMIHYPRTDFHLDHPDDRTIEAMFEQLVLKRDLLEGNQHGSLRANMMGLSIDNKWSLVYNDQLIEWHAARTRRHASPAPSSHRSHSRSPVPVLGTRSSPEFFLRRILDRKISVQDLEALAVTLRTCAMGWIEQFVREEGTRTLGNLLDTVRHSCSNEHAHDDAQMEFGVLKVFRALFNSRPGANDALRQPKCIASIVHSITSPYLPTRRQVADILLFLCHWAKPLGQQLVLRGFDDLRDQSRFEAWLHTMERTIDDHTLDLLVREEYAVNNLFLLNALVASDIAPDAQVRMHLRKQLDAVGLQRILTKLHTYHSVKLDQQVAVYETSAATDLDELCLNQADQSIGGWDLTDPVDVFKRVVEQLQGTRAYDFFVSALQHLLLIPEDPDGRCACYQLIDWVVQAVTSDDKGDLLRMNVLKAIIGVVINDAVQRFSSSSGSGRETADAVVAERDKLRTLFAQAEASTSDLQAQLKVALQRLALLTQRSSPVDDSMQMPLSSSPVDESEPEEEEVLA